MEVAISVGNVKVTSVGNLEVGTYFYALGGQYDLAGLGVVLQGPKSERSYVMLTGNQPFHLKLMGGGGEQRQVIALDTDEILLRFAGGQVGDNDPYALGAVVVSGAGAEVVIQVDGAGGSYRRMAFCLGPYTINQETPVGEYISLKRWTLVSRDPRGDEVTLFETA